MKIRTFLIFLVILHFWQGNSYTMPCSELTDIPESLDQLVPVGLSEGKKEIHVYRKYFMTRKNQDIAWDIEVNQDMLLRMRVQSPNTNFKITLGATDGSIIADSNSVVGYGASISSVLAQSKLGSDKIARIKFQFYDFLKTPEEIIEHEDVHDCHLPHIVLELSIMSKEEFISRKQDYLSSLPSDVQDTFPDINDQEIGYHDPNYGNDEDEETSLKLSSDSNFYTLTKTDSESKGKFQILKEYHIKISSEEERKKNEKAQELMYYLQLQITADFMTSGSMHVIVAHEDDDTMTDLMKKETLFAYDSLN